MLRALPSYGRLLPHVKSVKTSPWGSLPVMRNSRAWSCRMRHQSSKLPLQPSAYPSAPNMSEPEMVRRLMRSQRVWWWVGSLILGGVGLVAFGPELKLGMSKHTAEVASRSLQDETLRDNTQELASQIVQTVLNDPKVLDQASMFLKRLVEMESTRVALRTLVIQTLNDPLTQSQLTEITKQTMAVLLQDPHTVDQLVTMLRSTVLAPETRATLVLLFEQLLRDDELRANVTQLVAHTFVQDLVQQNVEKTLSAAVHDVLSRRDVQNHAKEFVSGVVRDQTVQAQGGEAIWGTFMYALTPSWLSWIWKNPVQLPNETGITTPAAEAAKVIAATENNTQATHKKEASDENRAKTNEIEGVSKSQRESTAADFAAQYEDRHWNGSGSGFV